MRRPRSLIVAIKDPGAAATPALEKAAQLARALDASLELLHVIALPVWPELLQAGGKSLPGWQREIRQTRRQQLERLASRLRADGLRVSCAAEWDHPPHEAIIRRARAAGAELIVVDRHGGREPVRWLFQYTDWELLRLSPLPVLLVGRERSYTRPVIIGAVDTGHAHDKPGSLDEEIAAGACLMASALRGRARLVHALSPEFAVTIAGLDPAMAQAMAKLTTHKTARARLTLLAKRYHIPVAFTEVSENFPELAAQEAVRSSGASVLVMGTVARRGLKRLAFGNTAERLIARVQCDLLVVKPPGFKTSVRSRRRPVEFLQTPVPLA